MSAKPVSLFIVLIAGLAAGFAIAAYLQQQTAAVADTETAGAPRRVLYWVAPMDPDYRRDNPGKSPMGMDLVPVYADDADGGMRDAVAIAPEVVNNVGVRTVEARLGRLSVPLRTVGRVTFDREKVVHIHLRSNGWIQRLAVRAEGEPVRRGDLLFEVYSPELVKAQSEFVQALASGRENLILASSARLRALGVSAGHIRALENDRTVRQYVRFFSPITGVVTLLNVADGKHVTPDTDIMALADLSTVWLISDVFEAQMNQLRVGSAVTAVSKFDPGARITGTVDYIYPDLNPVTRTVPVRTVLPNPNNLLKPGMFMTVTIDGPERSPAVLVPREGLIRTGREERVILALGGGRFRPAKVSSGKEAHGDVEILSGLAAGETIVVSGQFLIDSESSFAGATLRMRPATDATDD
jgi:Cu(I)/Ag(I) efflux system membrane fusion protein